jgi:hypothetical protein
MARALHSEFVLLPNTAEDVSRQSSNFQIQQMLSLYFSQTAIGKESQRAERSQQALGHFNRQSAGHLEVLFWNRNEDAPEGWNSHERYQRQRVESMNSIHFALLLTYYSPTRPVWIPQHSA